MGVEEAPGILPSRKSCLMPFQQQPHLSHSLAVGGRQALPLEAAVSIGAARWLGVGAFLIDLLVGFVQHGAEEVLQKRLR